MIRKGGKEISGIYFAGKAISAMYNGAVLVWEAVKSCFGKGFWINDKPWINDDSWKNK